MRYFYFILLALLLCSTTLVVRTNDDDSSDDVDSNDPSDLDFADFACLNSDIINLYGSAKFSVCKISWENTYSQNGDGAEGSGVLVNNIKQDGKLYVLTAAHNLPERSKDTYYTDINDINRALMENYIFEFHYFREECNESDELEINQFEHNKGAKLIAVYNSYPSYGPQYPKNNNANSIYENVDMALLELEDFGCEIEEGFKLYYSGWNANLYGGLQSNDLDNSLLTNPTEIEVRPFLTLDIGHPFGFPLKVSAPKKLNKKDIFVKADQSTGFSTWEFSNFEKITDEETHTSVGNSGSPVYNSNMQIYAIHVSGATNGIDYFRASALSAVWTDEWESKWQNPELHKKLSYYLDPDNTGVLKMDGAFLDVPRSNKRPRLDNQNIRKNIAITKDITGDQSGTILALQTIEGEKATIQKGASIEMIAGDYTEFKAGFKVEKEAKLLVKTGESTGLFCIIPPKPIENKGTPFKKWGELYGNVSGAETIEVSVLHNGTNYILEEREVTGNYPRLLHIYFDAISKFNPAPWEVVGQPPVNFDVTVNYKNEFENKEETYAITISKEEWVEACTDYPRFSSDILHEAQYVAPKAGIDPNRSNLPNFYQPTTDWADRHDYKPDHIFFDVNIARNISYAKAFGHPASFFSNLEYNYLRETPIIISASDETTATTFQYGELVMDVYYPKPKASTSNSDLTANPLPLIIYLSGGAFVSDFSEALDEATCQWLAEKGSIVAAIDYRLGIAIEDEDLATRAMIRAWQDLQAAIKYFRIKPFFGGVDSSPEERWFVDRDRIYGLGWGAGGITALHNTYLRDANYYNERSPGNILFSTTAFHNITIEDGSRMLSYDLENYPTMPCVGASLFSPCTLTDTERLNVSNTSGILNKIVSLAGGMLKKEWMLEDISVPVGTIHHLKDKIISPESKPPFYYLNSIEIENSVPTSLINLPKLYGSKTMKTYANENSLNNYSFLSLPEDEDIAIKEDQDIAGGLGFASDYHIPQLKFGDGWYEIQNKSDISIEPKIMFYDYQVFYTLAPHLQATDAIITLSKTESKYLLLNL